MYRAFMQIVDGRPRQWFVEAAKTAEEMAKVKGQPDIYMSLAVFSERRRTADAAIAANAFFVDIDVSHNSHYASKRKAAEAVQKAVEATGLRPSLLVDSGGGLHVYWVMRHAVPADEWRRMARRLRGALEPHLQADWGVTVDIARVARVIGTLNSRTGTVCRAVWRGRPWDPADFADRLPELDPPASGLPVGAAEIDVPEEARWRPALSEVADACAVVRWHYETRGADADEPQWQSMVLLSLFVRDDPFEAARRLSDGHPEYDPEDLQKKLEYKRRYHEEHDVGPPTCEYLASIHPGACDNCPLRGRIRTPVEAPRAGKVGYTFDELCRPVYYTKDGAIWKAPTKEGEPPERIIRGDLRNIRVEIRYLEDGVVHTIRGLYDDGKAVWPWSASLPAVATPTSAAQVATSMFGAVIGSPAKVHAMVSYLTRRLRELATLEHVWPLPGSHPTPGGQVFVLGDRAVDPKGRPLEGRLENASLRRLYTPTGSETEALRLLRQWFAAEPRPAARAFVCAAAAAPFYHLLATDVPVWALTHRHTGSGKTQTLTVAEVLWMQSHSGRIVSTTAKALGELLSRQRHLPLFWDEARPDVQTTEMLFAMLQGRGRYRLRRSGELREQPSYATFLLATSNRSIASVFGNAALGTTTAGMARVLELRLPVLQEKVVSPVQYDNIVRQLQKNAGQIGWRLLRDLWGRRDELIERADTLVGTYLADRPPSDVAQLRIVARAAALTRVVAEHFAGLFDLADLPQQLDRLFDDVFRRAVSPLVQDRREVYAYLRDFLHQHSAALAILRGTAVLVMPHQQPIVAEVDVAAGRLAVDVRLLGDWLRRIGGDVAEVEEYYRELGAVEFVEAHPLGGPAAASGTVSAVFVVDIDRTEERDPLRTLLQRLRSLYPAERHLSVVSPTS